MKSQHPKILVFSTEKISDPAIDLAGLLKKHYPFTVYAISVPCSSGIKPRWIMRAFEKGFDGVFIAADGTDCSYGEQCTERTGDIIQVTHQLMRDKGLKPSQLKMAAICSVCAEPFVKHVTGFMKELETLRQAQ
ncbi:hydrogenase iron-sulfur subunit [Williamwhitmania taraxaci]|uniref:Coenzyme F420-reducing hydrogenase, delta subunit n=1 Tax=Williamwhitmania taraxaci TaxID=1640674 RepID=A0A1G6HGB3_9BACT|nr:hydrogenase iron-sulfur subunit [Williamwhitmania taraxaci]SDB93158.1 Coenzyme F420-reducing hydrogenase, delta subunit [Williamwhitmania taraxaci]